MSSNAALDRFWGAFRKIEPTATLGGIDADKPGYHEKRDDLIRRGQGDDYSVSQVAADRRGSGTVACAIDITLPSGPGSKMTLYTGRLRRAALARDPRLYLRGGPTLREYIGTSNGYAVECYVFTGGKSLRLVGGGDSGFDLGRDTTHLWHIHLSVIRQYAEDQGALDAVLSVLAGESLADWQARQGDDMTPEQANKLDSVHWAVAAGIPNPIGTGRIPFQVYATWLTGAIKALTATVTAIANDAGEGEAIRQLHAELQSLAENVSTQADAELTRDAALADLVHQLLDELDTGTLTQDELVSRIRVSVEPVNPPDVTG